MRRLPTAGAARFGAILALVAATAFMAPAWAADPAVPRQVAAGEGASVEVDPWRFNAAAYGWLINVSGSVTARGQTVDTNASFIDLVQKSQSLGGLMAYFEADKGKAGMYVDFVYTNLGFGANSTSYRNPIAGLKITTSASAALTYRLFIVELGGVYEAVRWSHSEGSSTAIDGVMAFRYWNNSIAASFEATANVDFSHLRLERSFGVAIARADTVQWVDPVFGVRVRHQFTPHQQFTVRGDIGGFGLGSQFSWQAVAVYSYSWDLDGGQKLAALLGFRALGVNYSSGSGLDAVGINETLYGPIIGLSYRF